MFKKLSAKGCCSRVLNGFSLKYCGPRTHRESPNLISALENGNELKNKIEKEVSLGRVMGPFEHLPISNLQVSPVGIVPKSDGVSWRFITHLSYPTEGGINDNIDKVHCTVRYTYFDRVIEMIGKRAELAVHDIKSAFRLLAVHPGDFDLLGFKIEDKYYMNKCLPMGCAVPCKIFEKCTTFLHWLVEKNRN